MSLSSVPEMSYAKRLADGQHEPQQVERGGRRVSALKRNPMSIMAAAIVAAMMVLATLPAGLLQSA